MKQKNKKSQGYRVVVVLVVDFLVIIRKCFFFFVGLNTKFLFYICINLFGHLQTNVSNSIHS